MDRNFNVEAPNRLWVADLSRIPTGEGPLWLAGVRDAFSRRIVGWKASDRADTDLVLGALEYAIWAAAWMVIRPSVGSSIIRIGAQDTAIRFTQRLVDAGARPPVGSVGDRYDTQSRICGEGCRLGVWPVIRVVPRRVGLGVGLLRA